MDNNIHLQQGRVERARTGIRRNNEGNRGKRKYQCNYWGDFNIRIEELGSARK